MDVKQAYVEATGHEPPEAPPEEAWQWSYTGKRAEQEMMVEMVSKNDLPPPDQLTLC